MIVVVAHLCCKRKWRAYVLDEEHRPRLIKPELPVHRENPKDTADEGSQRHQEDLGVYLWRRFGACEHVVSLDTELSYHALL